MCSCNNNREIIIARRSEFLSQSSCTRSRLINLAPLFYCLSLARLSFFPLSFFLSLPSPVPVNAFISQRWFRSPPGTPLPGGNIREMYVSYRNTARVAILGSSRSTRKRGEERVADRSSVCEKENVKFTGVTQPDATHE